MAPNANIVSLLALTAPQHQLAALALLGTILMEQLAKAAQINAPRTAPTTDQMSPATPVVMDTIYQDLIASPALRLAQLARTLQTNAYRARMQSI